MDADQAAELLCLVRQMRDYLYLGVWTLELIVGQLAIAAVFKARERKWL